MDVFRRDLVSLMPRLRRLAWVVARSEQDAQELLQVTLERALARQDGWQEGSRLDQWVFAIMRNAWIDEVRTRQRWGKLVKPLAADAEPTDGGAEVRELERRSDQERVRRAVEELPEEQRLPVKLVLLGELGYREAAALLEIPEGTLTSRLSRGRAALIERLNKERQGEQFN